MTGCEQVEPLWVCDVPRRVCCPEHWWQPGVAISPETAAIAHRFTQIVNRETWSWSTWA